MKLLAIAPLVLFCAISANALQMCQKQNGGWGSWMEWSPCSKTCGEGGMKVRHRHCNSPVAKYGGAPCSRDNAIETAKCDAGTYDKVCPPEGVLGEPIYGKCSKRCGGYRSKTYSCDKPKEYSHNGYDAKCYMGCSGNSETTVKCRNRCADVQGRNLCRDCYYQAMSDAKKPENPNDFVGLACKLKSVYACKVLSGGIRDMYPTNDWFFIHCSDDGPWCKPCAERSLVYNPKCGQCESTRDGPCTGPNRWQDGEDKDQISMDTSAGNKDILMDENLW